MMTRTKTVLLAAALVSVAPAAFAQSQDASSMERNLFQGLMSGLGLMGEDRPAIDYRERAPLVIPRNNALPAPQDAGAARGSNWPNDPDVARARAAGQEASRPIVRDELGRTLTNSEMRARQGGLFGGGSVDTTRDRSIQQTSGPATAGEMGVRPIWQQVGSMFGSGARENEVVPFPGEQPRRRLVEPPPGYRTASPDAPYGPTGRRVEDPHAAYNRQQTGQDPARGAGR